MHTAGTPRVAALYDIHGNLPALEAALDAADAAGVDAIVVGGDVALGPMPREALDRVVALGPRARVLSGNCDRLLVDAFDGRPLAPLPAAVQEAIAWCAGQLDRAHRDFLAALPPIQTLDVGRLGVTLFCHASPRSDDEIVTAATPADRVRPMLAGVAQRVVVCGHTHMHFDRVVDGVRVVNAGSVGMPYGLPGAHWLLLGPGARPVRTEYDLERAAALVRQTRYPQADEFAARHVLDPYPAEAMLGALEPRAVGGPRPAR